MADAATLLDERAAEDARALAAQRDRLPLRELAALSRERRDNLLRWWLDQAGAPPPSVAITGQIRGLLRAPSDREARVTWGGHTLRRYRGDLYLLRDGDLQPLSGSLHWRAGDEPPDSGLWRLLPGEGEVTLWVPPGDVQLRPFVGGERLRRHGQRQQVSELWRVAGVPPWRRRQWPLLYQDDELMSVPMIGVADGVDRHRCRPWQLR
ncbi:tRNA lysidine(34) synthetase TilS [Alcanivorax xiamenensis]|uniref:tRNA lysidine(34) synthetase TilS n=1 Tax=Alcanivorax xiamenensis TaxID=1177156 RepID=UPI001F2D2EBF|nr:tRNA lysidine(34) synthetase TilS [Alcanivorax xiamenensis]